MKLAIKCKKLSNKGNGKKCKLGPMVENKYPDCVFKKNGLKDFFSQDQKIKFIYSLSKQCYEWHNRHENKKQTDIFFKEIEPQIEKICEMIIKK